MFGKGHIGSDVRARDVRMDGKAFAKVIKEAGVMSKTLDTTRVDLCFTKSCDKVRPAATSGDLCLHTQTSAPCLCAPVAPMSAASRRVQLSSPTTKGTTC